MVIAIARVGVTVLIIVGICCCVQSRKGGQVNNADEIPATPQVDPAGAQAGEQQGYRPGYQPGYAPGAPQGYGG
jgi:hypothetical protein